MSDSRVPILIALVAWSELLWVLRNHPAKAAG
jgi:hypothetical protein